MPVALYNRSHPGTGGQHTHSTALHATRSFSPAAGRTHALWLSGTFLVAHRCVPGSFKGQWCPPSGFLSAAAGSHACACGIAVATAPAARHCTAPHTLPPVPATLFPYGTSVPQHHKQKFHIDVKYRAALNFGGMGEGRSRGPVTLARRKRVQLCTLMQACTRLAPLSASIITSICSLLENVRLQLTAFSTRLFTLSAIGHRALIDFVVKTAEATCA